MLFSSKNKLRRVTTVFQMEATECGAACLGMILSYYHYYEPLEKLRVACGVSRNGSKASLIIKAAAEYKLKGTGYKIAAEELTTMKLPMIIFWNFEHYVVFEGRRGKWFYVNDPARGKLRYSQEEFEKCFTGIALTFEKTPEFKPHGKRNGIFFSLLPLFGRLKSVSMILFWAGLLLIVPGMLLPSMLQIFIDEIISSKAAWLYPLLGAYALTLAIEALLTWLTQVAIRRGELKLSVNTTLKMLEHLFSLPIDFFAQRNSADLQRRIEMNAQVANVFFHQVANNIVKLFTASFFLFLMLQFSPFLSSIVVTAAILNFWILSLVNKKRQTINQAMVTAEVKLGNSSMTGIDLMEPIRASGRDNDFFREWSSHLTEYANQRHKMQYSNTLYSSLPLLLFGINNILVLCVGSKLVIDGELTLGGMMAFQALMGAFIEPVNALVMAGSQIQELTGSLDRIKDIMRYPSEKRFATDSNERRFFAGKLELRNISFGYSRLEKPLIEDFSLTLNPGGRIALVGASGSGKSTVAKIAAGIYAPWNGEILLDDVPLEQISQESFHKNVATVDQSIMLFTGSVGDNLTLFQKRTDNRVLHQALRDAAMEEELARRGQLLAVNVSEMGNNFSGGQRQRLEIARALARNTPILILDEATSALDPVTELLIDKAIRRRGCSCLVIAHRLSTIRDCDEIIMMSDGHIVERGTHDQLMEKNGAYAHLMTAETEITAEPETVNAE